MKESFYNIKFQHNSLNFIYNIKNSKLVTFDNYDNLFANHYSDLVSNVFIWMYWAKVYIYNENTCCKETFYLDKLLKAAVDILDETKQLIKNKVLSIKRLRI